MRNWKVIVGVLGVFVLGMVAGGLVTARVIQKRAQRALATGSPRAAELVARRLGWELRLDGDQRRQVLAVMQDTQRQLQTAYSAVRPQTAMILAEANQRIRAVLRSGQQEKYDRIVADRRAKWLSRAHTPGDWRGTSSPPSPVPTSANTP